MLSIVRSPSSLALAAAIALWGLLATLPLNSEAEASDDLAAHSTSQSHNELIGGYGGSFDPPTLAHERIIRDACGHYHLDKFYVFVNTDGKKIYKSSDNERIQMLKVALADLGDKVVFIPVASQEKKAKIVELSKTPHSTFYQFVGEDSFQDYKRGVLGSNDRIHWVVYRRPDQVPSSTHSPQDMPTHFEYQIEPSTHGISSTHARTLIQEGNSTQSILNPRVAQYIEAHDLYPSYSNELLARQRSLHEKGFKKFVQSLQVFYPKLDLLSLPTPPFEPAQSREGRSNLFVRWVAEQNKFSNEERAALEAATKPLLSKIPYLQTKRAVSGCIRETMSGSLK